MSRFLLLLSFVVSLNLKGQDIPDSVLIVKNTYVNRFEDSDTFYSSNKYFITLKNGDYYLTNKKIAKENVLKLEKEVTATESVENSLDKYGIDTIWIMSHPDELLRMYNNKEKVEWNVPQKEYIFKELTSINNYREVLDRYLSDGCCYTMHHWYKNEYLIKTYHGGKLTNQVISRKHVWGYEMPWSTNSGNLIFNYNIEKSLNDIIPNTLKTTKPLSGNALLKYMVQRIIGNSMQDLYKLAAYSYLREIEELKTDFSIISFEEVYGGGRYTWYKPGTMKIVLHNQIMQNNVNLIFLASKQENTIYSRDSIKKDYKDIISRIQSIHFITDYLKSNPNSRLDVYYFNNRGINEYNIKSINKVLTEWDRGFIEKAIFFEINEENNNSIWFLLPDNQVLLYLMQGEKVLNHSYSEFGEFPGIQYPRVLFDVNGQRISINK